MKSVSYSLLAKSVIAASIAATTVVSQAEACSADSEYIGSICYMAIKYCPQNYLPADGRILNVNGNQALYALIGNIYGGSAPTTFALPDLRGRTAMGTGQVNGAGTIYAIGQKSGQETASGTGSVTLTANQLPSHTHSATLTLNGTSGTTPTASGPVSLALSGNITNLPFSAVASLGVSGIAKIGSSTTTGRNINLTDKALLTSVGGPAAMPYAPAGASNDRQLGPDGSVTGTASGTISGSASGGQLTGTASGNVSLPVTGVVTVGPNTATAPTPVTVPVSVPVRDPSLALTPCIAVTGIFPTNPN